MNQFKSAWQFAFQHWQFLAVMAFPVFLFEVMTAYYLSSASILLESGNIDDLTEYFTANALPITLLAFISIILSMSFIGGIYVAFNAITINKAMKPFDALFIGFRKFFPILGASILCNIAIFFGFFMLILPAFYIAGRLGLTISYLMLENKSVSESISASWEATDEHGTILFVLTLTFFILASVSGLVVVGAFPDLSLLQNILAGMVEYIFIFPLSYVYFSLYKSLKSSEETNV